MNFTAYVEEQLHLHPSTQPRDVIKQCYQAAKELLQSILILFFHFLLIKLFLFFGFGFIFERYPTFCLRNSYS